MKKQKAKSSATAVMDPVDMEDVMVDLEAYSTGANCAILQIGCVLFDSRLRVKSDREFIADIHVDTAVALGGEIDPDTVDFWRKLGGFVPYGERVHISTALQGLKEWLEQYPKVKRVWAQGPQMDVAALEGYYKRSGLPCPWEYNRGRDTRTVYELARWKGWEKPQWAYDGNTHQAVEDCRVQIATLFSALDHLELN